jgi:transcription initiation factor TFIIIB Brf1 subunit/transcription initiation factor TFIIB
MIHPTDPETRRPLAVRDGHGAPVTCAACGCRLRSGMADDDIAWFHFDPLGGRDARGCRVPCVVAALDGAGYRGTALALA